MLAVKERMAKELKWDRTAMLKLDALGSPMPLRAPRLRLDLIIAQGVGLGPTGGGSPSSAPAASSAIARRRSSSSSAEIKAGSGTFLVILIPGGAGKRPPRAIYNSAWATHGADKAATADEIIVSDSFVRKLGLEVEGDLLVRICKAEPSIAGLAAASLSTVTVLMRAQVNTLFAPGSLEESYRLAVAGRQEDKPTAGAKGGGAGKGASDSDATQGATLGGVIRLSLAKNDFDGKVFYQPECLPRETTIDLIFSPIDGEQGDKNDGPRFGNEPRVVGVGAGGSGAAGAAGAGAGAASAAAADPHPRILGFLEKEGGSLFSSWRRRFVVLCDGKLSYYNSAEDGMPLATLDCEDYRAHREAAAIGATGTEFVVHPVDSSGGAKTFRFRSATPEQRVEWIMGINASHHMIHGEL